MNAPNLDPALLEIIVCPASLCSTLGIADFILVPAPAAMITTAATDGVVDGCSVMGLPALSSPLPGQESNLRRWS